MPDAAMQLLRTVMLLIMMLPPMLRLLFPMVIAIIEWR